MIKGTRFLEGREAFQYRTVLNRMSTICSEARFPATANLFLRGSLRREAVSYGVNYYEEKGLLTSSFIFRGEISKISMLHQAIKVLISS